MAGIPACFDMRQLVTFGVSSRGASHETLTCSMSLPFSRQGLHVRHLGSKRSLSSCRSLAPLRSDRLRPAMPRQGRLLCQAAKQSQVSLGFPMMSANQAKDTDDCTCCTTEPVQTSKRDGWSAKGAGRPARGSVLWSCTAVYHYCWSSRLHSRVTCTR